MKEDRQQRRFTLGGDTIHLRIGSKRQGIHIASHDIRFIEASACYSWIHLTDGSQHLSCHTIGYYESLLSDHRFLRIHRSYLINPMYVTSYEPAYRLVYLRGERVLPVSYRKNRQIIKDDQLRIMLSA